MLQHLLRPFFGQIMPAVHGATRDLGRAIATPGLERLVPLTYFSLATPQDQHWALHFDASAPACPIMLQIDAGSSAIVFAHADDRIWPSCRGKIIGERVRMEEVCGFWFARGMRLEPDLGRR